MMGQHDEGAEVGGVRNADLRDKFRAYCKAAVTMLNSKLDESGDQEEFVANVPGFILQRTGSVEPSDSEETDWRAVVRRWGDAVKGMEESQSAVQALEDDTVVAAHLGKRVWFPGWGTLSPRSDTWVEGFLIEVLHEGGGQFEDAVFDRLYSRMQAYFHEKQLELRLLAPLGGFDMEGDPIEIGPRLRIVPLIQADMDRMAQLWRSSFPGALYNKPWSGNRRWAFELYLNMKKHVDDGGSEARKEALKDMWSFIAPERFDGACSVLRAHKKGDVWYDFILGDLTSWIPANKPLIGGSLNLWTSAWREYTLSVQEAAELAEFSQRWGKAKHWEDLDVGIRRFSLGCERSSPVDRLIDYVIALEALLLPEEKEGEYSYRLSLRGAALLGKDPLDRAAVRRNLQVAYDTRSSIVHGTNKKPETEKVTWHKKPEEGEELAKKDVEFRDFVDYVSDYLRALIEKLGRRVDKKGLVKVVQEDITDEIAKGFATPKQS